MKKKRKIWRWIIPVVLVVAVVAVILITGNNRAAGQYTEETVRTGNLETFYTFSGNIDVKNSQSIKAKANATVREIYVEEMELVAVDDPLMRLSNGEVVKADIAGEVTELYVSVGDAIAAGGSLVDIVDFEDLRVIVRVDEYDMRAMEVGKEASVTVEALDLTYTATVEYISKQAAGAQASTAGTSSSLTSSASANSVTYYEARLTPPPEEANVLPGMQVEAKVLGQHAENAMLLPMSALQFDDYNKPYVYIRGTDNSVVEQYIGVGIQDGTTVEITEGLRAGEVVLVPNNGTMMMFGAFRQ